MFNQKPQLIKINSYPDPIKVVFIVIITQMIVIGTLSSFVLALDIDRAEPLEEYIDQTPSRATVTDWEAMGLWNDIEELNTIAVGNVDNTHPGDEVVVAGNSNKVTVVYGFGNNWIAETVFTDSWYITSMAIGDVYPLHPGNEIVIVGWSTYVTLIYKSTESGNWINERLYHDYDWLYDVAIGDIYPEHPGNEILSVGDPRHVLMINYSTETNSWSSQVIWDNTPDINVIAIGDFNSTHLGSEVAVTGVNVKELKLREIHYNYTTGKWNNFIMGEVEKDPLEMVVGDFYSGHPGDELALVSIQRTVMMIYQGEEKNAWVMEKLWQDSESIRDIELADISSEHPGDELIVVGYSNLATLLLQPSDQAQSTAWVQTTIYKGGSNLNSIAVGEFDAFHSGLEVAVLQSTGKVLKLQPMVDGFNLFTPQARYLISAGNDIKIPIILVQEGNFLDTVALQVENDDDLEALGINSNLNATSSELPNVNELLFTISDSTPVKDYKIKIIGTSSKSNLVKSLNFTLSVLPKTESMFNLTIEPELASVVADFSANFQVKLNKINSWNGDVEFDIRYLPPGMDNSISGPTGTTKSDYMLTLTTTSSTPLGRNFIVVTAISELDSRFQYSSIITLDVLEPEPDFILEVAPIEVQLRINGTSQLKIYGFSYFGFDEQLSFVFSGLPAGVNVHLEPETFIPTGNASITLSSTQKSDIKKYNVTIIGIGLDSKINHTAYFHLIMLPGLPSFELTLDLDNGLRVYVHEIAVVEFIITPIAGFNGEVNITLEGLKGTSTWNEEISPIYIDTQKVVEIKLSGLENTGVYDLTIVGQNGTQIKNSDFQLEILPKMDSDEADEFNNEIIQIMVLIVILIIILIFVIKLTKRTSPPEQEKKDEK